MFKYVRMINTCSGMIETVNLPEPSPADPPCSIGTICYVTEGRLTNMPSDNGAKYLVLSNPNKNGEQTCLRIMSGMILEAETFFDSTTCNIGDCAVFYFNENGITESIELNGGDCEIIDTAVGPGRVNVIVL